MRWTVPVLLAMCAASSLFLFSAHTAMRHGRECPEVPFPVWEPPPLRRQFPRARNDTLSACAEAPLARTRFALVAYLAGRSPEGYAQGAAVLARTLSRFTDLDRVLITTDAAVTPQGWTVCTVPTIPNLPFQTTNRFTDAHVYSKFNAWRLVEYEAILVLDLDTLVVADPTDAFTVELPAMLASNATLGAALDRPASGCERCEAAGGNFNSGVLLVVPSLDGFQRLTASILAVPHDATYRDQSLLNAVYAAEYYELPFAYNANLVSVHCEPDLWAAAGDVRIIHYTVAKPWGGSALSLSSDNPLACAWNGVRPYCELWRLVREPSPRCMWRPLAPDPV